MRATWLRSAHWPPQSPARPMSSVAPLTLRQRSRPGRPSSRRGVNDRGVGHPAALTHLAVVPRSRPRGLTPIRTPISSPCPSASTNKPAAQRVPAGIQTCSAGNWGSSGRRFKSCQPDKSSSFVDGLAEKLKTPQLYSRLNDRVKVLESIVNTRFTRKQSRRSLSISFIGLTIVVLLLLPRIKELIEKMAMLTPTSSLVTAVDM